MRDLACDRAVHRHGAREEEKAAATQGRGGHEPDAAGGSARARPADEAEARAEDVRGRQYVVRMDQPYSRIADTLLDYQYWSPNDPQKNVYDDTGWTFGELGNVQVARVTDLKVLDAPMERVEGDGAAPGGVEGAGEVFVDQSQRRQRARSRCAIASRTPAFEAAEEPFEAGGREVQSRIVPGARASAAADRQARRTNSGVQSVGRGCRARP